MPPIKDTSRDSDLIRELKDKLQLSGSTLRTILKLSENIVIVLNKDGIVIEASNQIERITGIPLKQIIGKVSWETFVPDEDIERITGYFYDRAKGTGNPPTTYTLRVNVPGEESRLMRVNVGFIPGTEDRIVIMKDLSPVVLEQMKTAETEERYRTVVENIKEGILICSGDIILFANNCFCRMTDYSREDIYTFSPLSLFHDADRDTVESLFQKSGNRTTNTTILKP